MKTFFVEGEISIGRIPAGADLKLLGNSIQLRDSYSIIIVRISTVADSLVLSRSTVFFSFLTKLVNEWRSDRFVLNVLTIRWKEEEEVEAISSTDKFVV